MSESSGPPTSFGAVEHVVVVTGSGPLDADAVAEVPHSALVIAADGALDHALAAGLVPAGLVGDLDSVSADGLEWARAHATIERHAVDKDHTDTELALAMAAELAPSRLTLIGAGERFDHVVAAIGALGNPVLTSVPRIDAWWGAQHLHVVHGPGRLTLELEPGVTISLVAMHGACTGVGVTGVRWPLDNADLQPLVGLGVSNLTVDPTIEIRVSTGVLTVAVVGHLAEEGEQ